MNHTASHLASREIYHGVVQSGRFLQEGGWNKLLAKEKKGLIEARISCGGDWNDRDFFILQIALLLLFKEISD